MPIWVTERRTERGRSASRTRSAGRRPSTERVSTWRSAPLAERNAVIQSAVSGLCDSQARHARTSQRGAAVPRGERPTRARARVYMGRRPSASAAWRRAQRRQARRRDGMEARRGETGSAWLNAQRDSPVPPARSAGHARLLSTPQSWMAACAASGQFPHCRGLTPHPGRPAPGGPTRSDQSRAWRRP